MSRDEWYTAICSGCMRWRRCYEGYCQPCLRALVHEGCTAQWARENRRAVGMLTEETPT